MINPVAIDIDHVCKADKFSYLLEQLGQAINDSGHLIEICDLIPDADKQRVAQLLDVFDTPVALIA